MIDLSRREAPVGFTHLKGSTRPAEVKADFEKREITFYAAAFGNVDEVGDLIEPGAFRKTISERLPRNLIKLFFDHWKPIGVPVRVDEDSKGLLFAGRVSKTRDGDEALQLTSDGVASHGSIGYDIVLGKPDELNGRQISRLVELKLYEGSPVFWPANEETSILSVKSLPRVEHSVASLPVLVDLLKRRDLDSKQKEIVDRVVSAWSDLLVELKALQEPGPTTPDGPPDGAPREPETPTPPTEPPTVEAERGEEISAELEALSAAIEEAHVDLLEPLFEGV